MASPIPPSAVPVPSGSLLANLRAELRQHPPFSQMQDAHVDQFLREAHQVYYAPGEVVLEPSSGVAEHLVYVRQGSITGARGVAETTGGIHYEPGDLFPVGALLGRRAVTATYTATEDTFGLLVPEPTVRALAEVSSPFGDFLTRRVAQFLSLSRQALQVAYSSQTLAEQSMETPLGALPRKSPLVAQPDTPVGEALAQMHQRRVGSVLVVDAQRQVQGILTRHDVLGRVALAQVPLHTPISAVMSHPVHCLDVGATAQDAALLMSRHALRHVPVMEGGSLVSVVSERDLFAMQRLSLKQVSTAIRAAPDLDTLRMVAQDIRRFAANLMGQGVAARQLTELISHLNDVLTERLVHLQAQAHGLDLQRACWLAFGSEGRREQTVATDQDNGLILADGMDAAERERWRAFALDVNQGLDACGYPLCQGAVMASNPQCCLTLQEWLERFSGWMEHGAPQDLLNASIYFDFRPLCGNEALAQPLRGTVLTHAARLPRFMKQMADNALRNAPPLNWRGVIETEDLHGQAMVDLKMHGTAMFVDVARLYALAHGVAVTNTRARFEAMGHALGVARVEYEAWISAFEFLQLLRLRAQLERRDEALRDRPNHVALAALNDIDRRVLKESFRLARRLQQRLELDYQR
ncbi:MAG: DUF294 nucleotidyltransferase-like domain-containing protein [Rhodoferax sp.]